MPRTIPAALNTHLQGYYQNLALCVKVTRQDAVVMGFTSHDKDLTFGGLTYEAASALDASAVTQQVGTGVDNLDIMGLLQSDKITSGDLRAGVYDGAKIVGSIVNWSSVGDGAAVLISGTIGNVTIKDEIFTAEFRSLISAFANQVIETTTPTCRVAKLGDARCGVALVDYQNDEAIEVVTDQHIVRFSDVTVVASDYYSYGRVIWLTGDNAGFVSTVKQHTLSSGNIIELQEAPPYTMQVGDTATLEAGCNRLITTCQTKFSNAVNFRGEPYLPGNATVMKSERS